MKIVLGYSGSLSASAAIPWLAGMYAADVIALTIDVGQEQPVEQLRARALACGAVRAHVIDARDEFARDWVMPALHAGAGAPQQLVAAGRPLIARKLVELAAIERADAVAHASADDGLRQEIAAIDPGMRVIAPALEWPMDAAGLEAYARDHGVFAPTAATPGRHLLLRRATDPAHAPDGEARIELAFRENVPVAINGIAMSAAELIESLSLIAGQYGIGWRDAIHAPAALVLRAACTALPASTGIVTMKLTRGEHVVLASEPGAYEPVACA